MRRTFSFLFKLVLAVVAVFLTFLIIFMIRPPWQKAVVEGLLEKDTARQWQVGTVQVSPVNAHIQDIFMLQDGIGAGIKSLDIEGPLWKSVVAGTVQVSSGTISGFNMDLSQIQVGDLTSEDWQSFLVRITEDVQFWEDRVDIILHKLAASGWDFIIHDVSVDGDVLLPGERIIPIHLHIVEADSRENGRVKLEPMANPDRVEL